VITQIFHQYLRSSVQTKHPVACCCYWARKKRACKHMLYISRLLAKEKSFQQLDIFVRCAVVFCPTGRFSFDIDIILPAPVPAPWIVNNPCPGRLSPVANSVAFLLVFLFPSSLAVDLPTRFSPKNHDVAHVPTILSVYSSVRLWVPFLLQLFLVLSTSSFFLCSVQDTFNMRHQIHISYASILFMTLFCNIHVKSYDNFKKSYFDVTAFALF